MSAPTSKQWHFVAGFVTEEQFATLKNLATAGKLFIKFTEDEKMQTITFNVKDLIVFGLQFTKFVEGKSTNGNFPSKGPNGTFTVAWNGTTSMPQTKTLFTSEILQHVAKVTGFNFEVLDLGMKSFTKADDIINLFIKIAEVYVAPEDSPFKPMGKPAPKPGPKPGPKGKKESKE
jgi:hypothetical protein